MALSDTAALVASLELKDQFTATANKFDRTLGGMERRVSTFGKISGQVGQGISNAVGNLQRIGVVGLGLIGANVAAGIATIARLEEVTAATNAVIASTGGVAGISAEQVRDLAEEYENLNATMDDKVIQSAENLLLTFTSINKDAFEPALEAALNMNQAFGGGEEGLQGTIIQVGKALQDPIRGLTALRRVGVNFTRAQEDQIRALVEANDLYGAQQVILQELGREFGGQFAAAGETATARFARFKDAIEDAQAALATALLPVLEKVTGKLTEFLSDPQTIRALEDVGENLADAFDSLVEIAGNLPWDSIGNAFRLMGTGSKALLDAFVALPPWVQTAVLTGWGLNKLTGGALGQIFGTLASGIIKGVLGINAGVVNLKAGTVIGGGGGTVVGPAGGGIGLSIIKFLGAATVVGLGAEIGSQIGRALVDPTIAPAREFEEETFKDALNRSNLPDKLDVLNDTLTFGTDPLHDMALLVDHVSSLLTGQESAISILERQRDILEGQILQQQLQEHVVRENSENAATDRQQSNQFLGNIEKVQRDARAKLEENNRELAQTKVGITQQIQASGALTERRLQDVRTSIEAKKLSTNVAVNVVSNVAITDITRRLVSQRISIGGTGGITIE